MRAEKSVFNHSLFCFYSISFNASAENSVNQQVNNQQQQDEAANTISAESKIVTFRWLQQNWWGFSDPGWNTVLWHQESKLLDKESLPHWLVLRDLTRQVEGHCVGINGLKALHKAVQNRIISHGYITTRVSIPEQNLSTGVLTLQILLAKSVAIALKVRVAPPSMLSIFSLRAKAICLTYEASSKGLKIFSVFRGLKRKLILSPALNPRNRSPWPGTCLNAGALARGPITQAVNTPVEIRVARPFILIILQPLMTCFTSPMAEG